MKYSQAVSYVKSRQLVSTDKTDRRTNCFIAASTWSFTREGKAVPVHAMMAYGGEIAPLFLNPGLVGGKWLTSSPNRFTPGEKTPVSID